MKPMLAATPDSIEQIRLPAYASYKYDGVRAIVDKTNSHKLVSRKLKPFRNPHVNSLFAKDELHGLDGELICGRPYGEGVFTRAQSATTNGSGFPDIWYFVFDLWCYPEHSYTKRLEWLEEMVRSTHAFTNLPVVLVQQKLVRTHDELKALEIKAVAKGYEGLIVRDIDAPYKYGRSTLPQGYLLKLKRFEDSEAEILEVIEEMENTNESLVTALGNHKRNHRKAGLVPKGRAGSVRSRDCKSGIEFFCAIPGDDLKDWAWKNRDSLRGRIFTYKYQPVGTIDKPRFPIYKGLRED